MTDRSHGEEQAAAAAFRQHRDQVFRYLLRKTGNALDAEELTQRVFVDAAAALRHNRPNSLLAWLYAVAERRFIDEVRRRARFDASHSLEEIAAAERTDAAHVPEVRRALLQAVAGLPVDQQRVVVLKLFRGYSFAEIAREVGANEAACKMRFSRGISSVRESLSQQGIER